MPVVGAETRWTAAGFATQLAGQVARAVLLARVLTPEDLGRFFLLRSFVGVAAILAQGGVGTVGLKRVAAAKSDPALQRATVRASGRACITAGLGVAAVASAAAVSYGFSIPAAVALGLLVATSAVSLVAADLCRGLGHVRAAVMIERGLGTTAEVVALLGAWLLRGALSLDHALVLVAGAGLVPLSALGWRLWRAVHTLPQTPARASARALMAESWPVTVNSLLWRGLGEADLWLVGGLLGAGPAGVYGLAMRLAAPLSLAPGIAAYRLAGPVAALHAADLRDDLQALLRRAAHLTALLTGAGWAAIATLGPAGIAVIFGPDYAAAFGIFLVLGAGRVISAAAGIGGTTMLMIGRQQPLMWMSLASSAATVAGGWLLIPRLGPIGAAWASAFGILLQNVLMIAAVRRYAHVRVDVFAPRASRRP